jgi:hypothetical protein
MTYSTGNIERDTMLLRAIKEAHACNDAITVESVATHLPADFGPDDAELDGMSSTLAPETLKKIEAPHAPEAAAPSLSTAEATVEPDLPPGTYELTTPKAASKLPEMEARRALDVANRRLMKSREQQAIAMGILRESRAALATAIANWQTLSETVGDGTTPEQRRQIEVRNHLESAAKDRAARAAQRNAPRSLSKLRTGFGARRGAYSIENAALSGFKNFDPQRGNVVKPQ